MVPADSQHIPRARCYSGEMTTTHAVFSRTGLSPTTAAHPRNVPLTPHTRPSRIRQNPHVTTPQPRIRNPCRVSHEHGLATIRFRSPLLTESQLFSLPTGTEMFHFPALPPPALCVQAGVTGNYARSGFPIRKSPDQCLVADFPGLIAGSNVLLRLLVPRHPPCALINLATTIDARVHCAVLKIRAVPVRTPPHPRRGEPVQGMAQRPFPQDPTACSTRPSPPPPFQSLGTVLTGLRNDLAE